MTEQVTVEGFTIPEPDESTKAVIRMTRNGYTHDYEFTYEYERVLTCSEDVPEDLGDLSMGVPEVPKENLCGIFSASPAQVETHYQVMSYEHNGTLIYP